MSKEPTYDGGKYCVEHKVEGKWKKRKTGKFLSRNWNHITLSYAVNQFERETESGNSSRIVYEPTNRLVKDNLSILMSEVSMAWFRFLRQECGLIRKREGEWEKRLS